MGVARRQIGIRVSLDRLPSAKWLPRLRYPALTAGQRAERQEAGAQGGAKGREWLKRCGENDWFFPLQSRQ